MTAALFSNPTWDSEGNDRQARIRELNDQFNEAIELVYDPHAHDNDIDWNNPFYAAAKRGLERTREKYAWAIDGEQPIGDIIEPMDKEQLQARVAARKSIDQV